jgi:hypothetical protein
MSVANAVAAAGDLLENTTFVNREILILADLQESTLGDSLTEFPEGISVRLAKVGDQSVANTAVVDVQVRSQIVEPGRPVQIEATLSAAGSEGVSSVLASVYLDEERSAQADVEIPANGAAQVDFVVTPRRAGWLEGWVEIEDDAFQDDNRRYFALAVPETRRVLLVSGEDFDTRYLTLAMSTEVAPGRTRFDLDAVRTSGFSSRRLTDYDVAILAGVTELSSGQISALVSYVSGGGGLLLFPPIGPDLGDLNTVLERLGGGRVEGLVGEQPVGGAIAVIDAADTEHPLFEGMFQAGEPGDRPRIEQLDVYRFASYRTANAAEVTVVRLSTGHSLLQEIPSGRGKALFVATLPAPEWSELPVRGFFVPLLYRSLSYLSAGESPAADMLQIGRTVDIYLAGASETHVIRIVSDDTEVVPAQRPAFGGMLITAGRGITEPGSYDVVVSDRTVKKLSANLDPAESDLRTLGAEEAAAALRGSGDADVAAISASMAPGEGGFADAVATIRSGVELWNVFLGVALVFLLAEMMVSRLWKPESSAA